MKHDSTQPLWQPSIERIDASNLKRFGEHLEHKLGVTFDDYQQLHQWSVEQPHLFWEHIWQFTGIRASQNLILAGKVRALLHGRYNVSFGDVRALAPSVLRHRVLLNFHAEAERITTDTVIARLLEEVPEPSSGL